MQRKSEYSDETGEIGKLCKNWGNNLILQNIIEKNICKNLE